jgi:hypothetical protein
MHGRIARRRLVGPTNFLAVVSGQWSRVSTQRWKILCHIYPRAKPGANDRLTLSTVRYYYFPVDQLRRSTHCLGATPFRSSFGVAERGEISNHDSLRRITPPDIFQRFGEGLLFDFAVGVAGVFGEDELVVVAFVGQNFGHVFVGKDPVVEAIAHGVGV